MKTRFYARILVLGCGILLFACVVPTACVWLYGEPKERIQPVDMVELLVEPSSFPAGWELSYSDRDPYPIPEKALFEDYYAKEGFSRVLVPQGVESPIGTTSARHRVFRYRNEWQAAEAFFLDHPAAFYASSRLTPWREPEGWSYRSSVADRFRFACADFEGFRRHETRCTAMAQYDEFVSVFSADMAPDVMTLEDVEHILKAIDERMAQHLKGNSR